MYIHTMYQVVMSAQTIAASVGIASLTIGVFPGLLVAPVLNGLGFSAVGPVAASTAAVTQAGMGNVAAGSTFALLQSAGMGGAGYAAVSGATQASAAFVASAAGVAAYMLGNCSELERDEAAYTQGMRSIHVIAKNTRAYAGQYAQKYKHKVREGMQELLKAKL